MKVTAVLPGFVPSTYLCVIHPLLKLQQQGKITFSVYLENIPHSIQAADADVWIFSRNVDVRYSRDLQRILAAGKPYIYDLDDDLFEVPEGTALGKYYHLPQNRAQLEEYLRNASLIRAYSPILRDKLVEYNSRVALVKPPVAWEHILTPERKAAEEKVKLVYSTSRAEDPLVPIILPAIQKIVAEFRDRVDFYILGSVFQPTTHDPDVYTWKMDSNYPRFMRRFSSAGFEIGLAPMEVSPFYSAKTNNKFREYAACKVAGIYSNVPLYQEHVTHGETGLLVENDTQSWYLAMRTLIEDGGLRQRIQGRAFQVASEQYSTQDFLQAWWDQLGETGAVSKIRRPNATDTPAPVSQAEGESISNTISSRIKTLTKRSPAFLFITLIHQMSNLLTLIKINRFKTY